MAQNAQTARGTRDVVPPEAELRRRVANRVLDVYASYGYEVIETPAFEDLSVLMGSEGGENEKLIFKVLKRGARLEEALARARPGESEELADLGMRFDLTVPLARFVANHLNELPMPFKVAHLGPVWRAERPARGRYREFTQCDIDIVGEPGVVAEVELCSATLEALERVGIHGCTVRLNDRRLLRATVEHYLGHLDDPGPVYIALDHLDRVDPAAVVAELAGAGHDEHRLQRLIGAIGAGEVVGPEGAKEGLQQTLGALQELGAEARFDPALVRGMGYYTGQIFEVSYPEVPYSLAGGGRYDGMTARFGAPALPMCGFSIGFERVCDLVDPSELGQARRKEFVTCANDEELLSCLLAARTRRAQDPDLALSVVRRARNARKQREDFQRLGYKESRLFP
jgi:histidyl-tRNA synthetase